MTHRTEIETVTLGAILVEDGAIACVVDILKPANFSGRLDAAFGIKNAKGQLIDITYANIYAAMLEMYPQHKLDIVTLTRFLSIKYGVATGLIGYAISTLTEAVASSANLQYWAFILVQESVKDSISAWVNAKVTEVQKALEFVTDGADNPAIQREQDFAQIRHRLLQMPDVFDQLDALRSFFSSYGYTDELEELEELASNVNTRTRAIRAQQFKNNQLNYLRHLANNCSHPVAALELVDVALRIINNEVNPSPQLINHINQLTALA